MAWRSIFLQLGLGVGAGWLTITAGFMLENLFLDKWPWWGWAIASIPAIGLIVLSIWMQFRLARPQRARTKMESAAPATTDYIGAGAIVDRYIEPALRDKRPGVGLAVRKDFLDRFDNVTGAKLGEYEYNRALLHQWMEANAARLLVENRGKML